MNISARNIFSGTISALVNGAVNAEVELNLDGGDKIVAIVTESSAKSLDLAVGKTVSIMGKANPDGSITAQSIQVRPPMPSQSPTP